MNLAENDLSSTYQSHRQEAQARSLIDQARERSAKPSQDEKKPAVEVRPNSEGSYDVYQDGEMVGGVSAPEHAWQVLKKAGGGAVDAAKDAGIGIVTGDVAKQALIGGPLDAVRNALTALDGAAKWADENLVNMRIVGDKDQGVADLVPDVAPARTATGAMAREVSTFLTGFIPLLKGTKMLSGGAAVSKLGTVAQVESAAATAGALVLDPHEERLSNLIQQVPALQNPVNDFLSAKPDDSEAEGRFKNALESLGFGAMTEGLFRGIVALRAMRRAKEATPATESQKALYGEVPNRDIMLLGDPNAPLMELRAKPEPEALAKSRRTGKVGKGQAIDLGVPDEVAAKGLTLSGEAGGKEVYINFGRINEPDDVKKVLGQMADAFSENIDQAKRGVQSNAETQKLADELGMTVGDILNRRKGQPFNAEESLAARNLWAASAAKLKDMAERAASPNAGPVDQYNFRKMMAVHYAIQAEVIGARTETARALQAWSIPAGGNVENARAIQNLIEAMGGPDVSKAMAQRIASLKDIDQAALNAVVRKGWLATTMDAVKESYTLGLLWNPSTHLVNTGSNLGVAFQQIYERAAGAQISRIMGREAGEGVVEGEATLMAYASVMALRDAFRVAGKALRTGEMENMLGKIDLPHEPAITSENFRLAADSGAGRAVDFIGAVTRVPGRLLGSQDAFFKTIGYQAELHALALRQATGEGLKGKELGKRVADILANPPEHIKIAAADEALYRTFTNQPGWFAQGLLSLRNKGDLNPTFLALTFVKTPANILRYSFERTPLAPLVGQWRADIAAGGARADMALARMATGSTIIMLTTDFAMSGLVSGSGPKDTGERETLIRQGWHPYSLKVGNKWYSYKRTDPFGMLMGFSADMVDALNRGEIDPEDMDEWQEVMAGAIAAVANTVVDKTYFEGVSRIFEAMADPQRFAPSYINNLMASFVPMTSALGVASRLSDPTAREVNDPWDAVMAKLPGLASRLTPKRDLWGEEIKPPGVYGSGYDVLSPIAVREMKDSPIDAEMTRLNMDVRRIPKKTSLAGVDINLREFPEVYDDYVRLAGNELKHPAWNLGAKDYLDAVVSGKHPMSQAYKILSDGKDGGKSIFIKSAIQEYRQLAAEAVLEKHPDIADVHKKEIQKKQEKRMPVLQ